MALAPEHRVLEVGTGSGYQTAVLSRLVRQVVSVERFRTLADQARARLKSLGYDTVEIVVGDGLAGLAEHAPYDRILVTAAAERIPETLTDQLAEGGVMLLPLGPARRHATPRQAYQNVNGPGARGPDPGALRAAAAGPGARVVARWHNRRPDNLPVVLKPFLPAACLFKLSAFCV